MSVLAVRGGNVRLVDDGDGMGHVESGQGAGPVMSVEAILKWGYWKPVEAVTAAAPLPGEGPLIRKYEQVLERNAKRCAANFKRSSRVVTAAGNETNRNPQLDEVLNESQLSESARKALKAAREKIARDAAVAQAVQFGISFAVSSPYLTELVNDHAGKQAERIVAGSRDIVARVIGKSLEEGWSVPQTADAIYSKLHDAKKWQATMLARTDLIGLANGGSFAAARALRELRPVYKRWVTADDEKVRPTHVEAEGQLQALDSPFVVGEASLMFPGDPHGADAEVINCRCTLVYTEDPAALISAGWDESEHPRHEEGSSEGGRFKPKGEGSVYDNVELTGNDPGSSSNEVFFGEIDGKPVVVKPKKGWEEYEMEGPVRADIPWDGEPEREAAASELAAFFKTLDPDFDYLFQTPEVEVAMVSGYWTVDGVASEATEIASVQDRIEAKSLVELEADESPYGVSRWGTLTMDQLPSQQVRAIGFFDAIIGNTDRHDGNVLVTPDGEIWAIDHGLSFPLGVYQSPSGNNRAIDVAASGQDSTLYEEEIEFLQKINDNSIKVSEILNKHGIEQSAQDFMWSRIEGMMASGKFPTSEIYQNLDGEQHPWFAEFEERNME